MSTPAIDALERAHIEFTEHPYDGSALDDTLSYGEAVAAQLGVAPERLFKTLITKVDGVLTVGIVPVAGTLDLKRLAKAAGGKKATMADRASAERATGYVTGGISPFGQRKQLPVVVDRSVFDHERVFVSGGKRGLQIEVDPTAFTTVLGARFESIAG